MCPVSALQSECSAIKERRLIISSSSVRFAEADVVTVISHGRSSHDKPPLLPVVQPEPAKQRSHKTPYSLDLSESYRCSSAVHPAWTASLLVLFQALCLAMSISLLVVAKQQNSNAFFYGGLVTLILQMVFIIALGAGGLTHPFFEFLDMRPLQDSNPSAAGRAALEELIRKDEAPRVDLFITCCKEALDIIQDTVLAAIIQDYPPVSYTVYILDDGGDDDLKQWVEDASVTWADDTPKLVYIRRAKEPGKCSNYKAGNLNHALHLTSAPYIAQLDADMIPTPDFLPTLMAAILEKPKAGFAFCTQTFYNWGSSDVLDDQQVQSMMVAIPRMESLSVAPNGGSGVVWLREALTASGGFRTDTKGEDFLTSWDVITRGYTSVYCRELLQCGLVPWSLGGWYRQHRRWDTSACEYFGCIWRQLLASPHLTWLQKYGMVGGMVTWIQPACILAGQWVVAISLLFFSFMASSTIQDAAPLRWMVFLGFFANIMQICHGVLLYKATPSPWEQYLRSGVRSRFENTWVAVWAAKYFLGIRDRWKATGMGTKNHQFLRQLLQYAAPHLLTWALWMAASVALLVKNMSCQSSVVMLAFYSNLVLIAVAMLPEILLPVWYYRYGVPKPTERKGMVPRDAAGVPCLKPSALWPARDWRVVAVMAIQPTAVMVGLITLCIVCIWAPMGSTIMVPFLCSG